MPRSLSEESPPRVKPTKQRIARLFGFARPYWWQLVIIMLTTSLTSALTLAYPALTGKIIDSVTQRQADGLHAIIFLLLGVTLAQAFIGFWQNFWMTTIGEKVVIDLRVRLYTHLHRLSLGFFQENRTGELMSRLSNDVTLVRTALTGNLISFAQNILTLILGIAVLLIGPETLLRQANALNIHIPTSHPTGDFGPTVFTLALTLLPLILLPVIMGRFLNKIVRQELELLGEATAASEEAISNTKIVKAFTREEYETQRYVALAQQQFVLSRRRARLSSILQALTTLAGLGGMAAFLWYGGNAVLDGTLTIGSLTMIVIYITVLSRPFIGLSNLYGQFQIALGAAERLFNLLDQPVTIADEPDAPPLSVVEGRVRFEAVEFGYNETTRVLHSLSFEAEPGKVLALVGPSGAGKTTIANLIPRFFDVQQGCITVDGSDIRHVRVKSLREQIGIVLQEPVLFGTTIRENIAYGRLDASQQEIEAVARAANAHEFILRLPDGYETLVGERGVKLSGGQRQRIAIARALLRDPRILILDEATSSLDNESEALVQEALERLMHNRTTIVIAHRLSTVQNADKIVVLEHGRIVEQGRHAELLAHEGVYHRLYTRNLQAQGDQQSNTDQQMSFRKR